MRSSDTVSGDTAGGRGYALLAAVVALAVVGAVLPLDGRLRGAAEGAVLLPPLAVAGFAWAAARAAAARPYRSLWYVVAGAHFLVACALILGVARDVAAVGPSGGGMEVPAGVLMLLYYPVLAGGLLLLRGETTKEGLAATMGTLDTVIFTMSAAVLSWQFILSPSLADSESLVGAAAAIAYPLCDVLLAFAIVYLLVHGTPSRYSSPLWLLLSGLVLRLGLDTANILLAESTQAALARTNGVLWSLTYALVGLGAILALRPASRDSERAGAASALGGPALHGAPSSEASWLGVLRMLLPYAAFPTVGILLYTRMEPEDPQPQLLLALGFAAALVALVMLRQFISLLETRRLSRDLLGLSEDLERQVDERTTELEVRAKNMAVLNYVVTELGYCLTVDEVASRALELAAKSAGSERGVVWIAGDDCVARIKTSHGVGEEMASALDPMLAEPVVAATLARGEPAWMSREDLRPVLPSVAGHLSEDGGLLLIPVVFRGTLIGAIGLLFEEDLPFSELDRELAGAIGGNLGVALANARSYDEARRLADRDSVTGLLNHRAIHERLGKELNRAQRGGHRLSLIMMDLDEFKLFNDTYGHPVGDKVLRDVAGHLQQVLRSSDVLGRYGGDEFLAILPETSAKGAVRLAQRLRRRVARNPFVAGSDEVPIRLSFGISTYPEDARQVIELVACADDNLYTSKEHGGDSVTSGNWSDEEESKDTGLFGVLNSLVTAVDAKDRYTRRHSQEVTEYSLAIARRMGLAEESQRALRIAGLLHDVGKIGVPDRILRKPGRLDEDEFETVRQHAQLSEMIMKEIPNLFEVQGAVGAHHERYDGAGYPRRLQGEDIPLLGRILAVADTYSAMTSDRPYRKALPPAEARAELSRVAGHQLDPRIVEIFLSLGDSGGVEADGATQE